jgi:hypothetical protein
MRRATRARVREDLEDVGRGGRWHAEELWRAAHCTVLFPLVALAISSVVEDYRWTPPALAGLALVMTGNVLVFRRPASRTPARPAAG